MGARPPSALFLVVLCAGLHLPAYVLATRKELAAHMLRVRQGSFSADSGPTADYGGIVKGPQGFEFVQGEPAGAVATGVYVDSLLTISNFGKLRIVTSGEYCDLDQMFAAGFLEGYLTAGKIYDQHRNLKSYFVNQMNASLQQPMEWLHKQEAWVRRQVANGNSSSNADFWRVVGLVLRQFDGLWAGYKAAVQESGRTRDIGPLTRDDILFLNCNGDLYDIIDMYTAGIQQAKLLDLEPHEVFNHIALAGKCSALIKVAGDLSDIYIGHSTWDSYTAMLRIYKHYEFNLHDPAVVSQKLSFSSYPGELFSDDDFYLTSSHLVVVETTNHIYNEDVFKVITPASVLSWQRVRTANFMARDGEEWVKLFSSFNSGTYNNQYMVVDLKKFKPNKELRPGLLWVVEQIPGLVQAADMTNALELGYWPSYNVAFFPEIYNASGYPDMIKRLEKKGKHKYSQSTRWLKYQISHRATIFRRDQGSVQSLDEMKRMMRYNDWQNDVYSDHDPVATVCGRGDLASKAAEARGCYDSKVTSWTLGMKLESEVLNGPTAQGQPPFEWSEQWDHLLHYGMPERFDFQFERMSPTELRLPSEQQAMQ